MEGCMRGCYNKVLSSGVLAPRWLRTEESQAFDVPMDVAATLDPKLLALLPFCPRRPGAVKRP